MVRTVIVEQAGGPENLKIVDLEVGKPERGQVRIRHEAIGLNYIDVYQRTGLYPLKYPHALGMEAAGIVEEIGEGVTHISVGDKVAYASMPPGSYCEARVMSAAQVCSIPQGISSDTAAAAMLKGMTVEYLFHRTLPLNHGCKVLFHAAAGGVGLIACQWAKAEGITLIGTAGGPEKCALAVAQGATYCIDYKSENFVKRVKELTSDEGVDAVMDGVGADTFERSLDCLKPLGMMISFGNASGPVPPINLALLGQKGSLKITRPTLFTHIANHDICQKMAAHVFQKILSKTVTIRIDQRFSLNDVADAHRAIESRKTTGSTLLIV
ncbi:MAG: quinone oxidoreductase [Aestuariivita sp.]|nr:quinone oxidoreductase [Aestuariivita sp.]